MPDKIFRRKVIVDVDEEETSRTRESWFQHIFNNIEKLSADLYSSKEMLTNRLNKAREEHYTIKDEMKAYVDKVIDKLRVDLKEDLGTLNDAIKSINDSIKTLEGKLSEHEIKRISDAKAVAEKIEGKLSNLRKDMDTKLERQISPVAKEVWLSKGKVIVWATIFGVLLAAGVSYVVRHF